MKIPQARKSSFKRQAYGQDLVFTGTDIIDGAEALWDPLILDQMFNAEQTPWSAPRTSPTEVRPIILRSLDLWEHIRSILTSRQYQILEHFLLHGLPVTHIAELLQVRQPVISMLLKTSFHKLRKDPLFQSLRHLL